MTKKLFSFAKGECAAESGDSPMVQEILLPGHLYQMVLKVAQYISTFCVCTKLSALATSIKV